MNDSKLYKRGKLEQLNEFLHLSRIFITDGKTYRDIKVQMFIERMPVRKSIDAFKTAEAPTES